MNKTLKMVLAAAGALVLGGLGEGIGAELLKKVTKSDDTAEDTSNEDTTAAEEPEVVIEEVASEEEAED